MTRKDVSVARWWCAVLCGGVLLAASGCVAPYADSRASRMASEREDFMLLREQMRRLEGRVEGLEMQSENLRGEWEYSQRDATGRLETELDLLQRQADELQRRINQLEAGREQDKQEIINAVSGTISKVIKETAPPARAPTVRRQTATSGYGYEHVVEAGQTLSAIAQAYGVTTATIIEANDMQDPNRLRVGQVLFIPE